MRTSTLLLIPLAAAAALTAQAQTRQVTGTVLSAADRSPLPGVSVLVKGTNVGTATGGDGTFSLPVAGSEAVLVYSFVGFETVEVRVGSSATVEPVRLREKSTSLNDVVVVGYGTQRRQDLTGSVASISAAQVAEVPISRPEQILQGRVSGVQVTQTNSEPGGGLSIRIRGTNSINSGNEPLFVIDGFPGVGDLNSINPSDIESIEVLKDASATAIYGSRGANGVVIVTTKKGKAGRNVIDFEAYTGVSNVRKPYELLNATQFATYLNDVQTLNNQENPTQPRALPYTPEQIAGLGAGTDWQKEIFRTARMSNYQLGFSGGTDATRYNMSFNYFDQQGTIINSGFKRASVRLNLDRKVSDKVSFSFTSQLSRTRQQRANVNTDGGSNGGTVLDALRFNPAVPVRDANGNYTLDNQPQPYVEIGGNPVAYAEQVRNEATVLRGLLNVAATYEIVPGLKLRLAGGTDINNNVADQYIPSTVYQGQNTNGFASKSSSTSYSWLNENTLTYDRKLNENNALNVVAGLTFQEFNFDRYNASVSNLFTNALSNDNLGIGGNVLTPGSGRNSNTLASYFGRVNYRLMEKYLFTFTMRADGSSRFGTNNKWGYFPSAAVAYRVIDENFMKALPVFTDLKLRASYGVTGNQEIGSYQSLARYGLNAYTAGTTRLVGLTASNIPNPDLTWESTASLDLGIDIGILQNRILLTADYYYKKTSDLLLQVSVPQTSGFSNILLNSGSVQNKGFELGLNTVNVEGARFGWKTSLNFSLNRNKVLDLNGETERFVGQSSGSVFPGAAGNTGILRVGQPIGAFYGYQFQGIWQTQQEITESGITDKVRPGDPRYADNNGNKRIDAGDRVIVGQAQPKFIYGVTNNFTFGPLGLSVFIQGVQGSDVLNLNRYELESGFVAPNKVIAVLDRWTGPGTSNTIPKANSVLRRSTGITSDVVEDGSFVRLKTATISYTLPVPAGMGKTVKSASIYVTGQNLITLTKYTGYDPEVNSFGNSNLSLNTDYNAFPSSRTYIAGIRIGF